MKVVKIRSDHGGEFLNEDFEKFCFENGYSHNFSAPRTPQQNGIIERKNSTLHVMARTMINEYSLKLYFWAETISTACYILNHVSIRPIIRKTPYELYRDRFPLLSYFRPFEYSCYILREGERVDKFDAKSDLGIFVSYAPQSKAYRVFNLRTSTIHESVHVEFDEKSAAKPLVVCDDSAGDVDVLDINVGNSDEHVKADIASTPSAEGGVATTSTGLPREYRVVLDHPND